MICIVCIFASLLCQAAETDTIQVYSPSMNKSFSCVVIKPDGYNTEGKHYPVVYLLHGYGGWYSNWITRVPQLTAYADQYQIFIVCPEGKNSWYLDSPLDSSMRFETYISKELPAFIDTHYHSIAHRNARAITGLSMGGHGALFLSFRHAEIFGACGSMSGGVDLRPFPKRWELLKLLGDTVLYKENWENYSVINLIENRPADSLAIIIDCGTQDFFYGVNKALHEKLLLQKTAHDYIERPGKHDWNYWSNAVQYQLLFFSNFFKASPNILLKS